MTLMYGFDNSFKKKKKKASREVTEITEIAPQTDRLKPRKSLNYE